MQGKTALKIILAIFAVLSFCLIFYQYQKYRALKSLAINAVLECKENLNFLYECDSNIRQTGDEISGLVKAQAGIQRTLQDRDISKLLRAGINSRKKDAISRLKDNINSYNKLLSFAFYGSTTGGEPSPEMPVTTGEMIKEILELEQMLEK